MVQNTFVKILLLPFSLLYGVGIALRNVLYKSRLLKSVSFNIPVVGVGNLSVGGAGKTPHIEYLIQLLSPYVNTAILSRGYKRKTKGFQFVSFGDSSLSVGDEPYQYFLKYKNIKVAVSESRSLGVPMLLNKYPETEIVLLDDSYQHRSVSVGLNILLTEFERPYYKDFLLPSGRLREFGSGASRSDIIIVTKCPVIITEDTKASMLEKLNPLPNQSVYFTRYSYGQPYSFFTGSRVNLKDFDQIILLTAIANESYLLDHLDAFDTEVHAVHYEDHHYFSPHEVSQVALQFDSLISERKLILTTEKDATRLMLHSKYLKEKNLPIYILPLKVDFLFDGHQDFNAEVKRFLLNFAV